MGEKSTLVDFFSIECRKGTYLGSGNVSVVCVLCSSASRLRGYQVTKMFRLCKASKTEGSAQTEKRYKGMQTFSFMK